MIVPSFSLNGVQIWGGIAYAALLLVASGAQTAVFILFITAGAWTILPIVYVALSPLGACGRSARPRSAHRAQRRAHVVDRLAFTREPRRCRTGVSAGGTYVPRVRARGVRLHEVPRHHGAGWK